ncbi:YqjF family protein [Georgenia soli]|uniref:YqjF family protein n=1 Tax=Georgenia soli TaxID=638953 RepID=UPI000BF78275|nr:DUF2071 domain-containing protein [Georgenia soli]
MTLQRWEDLTFLHWSLPAATIQECLPPGLAVDTFDGRAWLGVTPFRMHARPAFGPAVPHLSTFTEINVRTYVRGPDGGDGLWFFSLECPRLPVVLALRAVGVPYVWADAAMRADPGHVHYRSRRRSGPAGVGRGAGPASAGRDAGPASAGRDAGPVGGAGSSGPAGMRASVEVGEPLEPDALTDFLTGRWSAYVRRLGRLWRIDVEHEPWPLRAARARTAVNDLVRAAGLPAVAGDPLVHFSPGVRTRLGAPVPVGD